MNINLILKKWNVLPHWFVILLLGWWCVWYKLRISHYYDSSYVFHFILDKLYSNENIDVNYICHIFEYDASSVYKILKKIQYNLITINPDVELVKIRPGLYKFNRYNHQ